MQALKDGIDEHLPVDFVIATYDGTLGQEVQLKRSGMEESNQSSGRG